MPPSTGETQMDILSQMIQIAKTRGLNGNIIVDTPADAISAHLKAPLDKAQQLVDAVVRVKATYPKPFEVQEWDENTWNAFAEFVEKELPPEPAFVAQPLSLFAAAPTPAPAQVDLQRGPAKPSNGHSSAPMPVASNLLRTMVLATARRMKAADPEGYELFSLNDRALDALVKGAERKFEGQNPNRTQIEEYVKGEMEGSVEYRQTMGDIFETARTRGWAIAPKVNRGQPPHPTTPETIGNADLAAIQQLVRYDRIPVEQAFDAMGFTARVSAAPAPVATAPAPGLFGQAG